MNCLLTPLLVLLVSNSEQFSPSSLKVRLLDGERNVREISLNRCPFVVVVRRLMLIAPLFYFSFLSTDMSRMAVSL